MLSSLSVFWQWVQNESRDCHMTSLAKPSTAGKQMHMYVCTATAKDKSNKPVSDSIKHLFTVVKL